MESATNRERYELSTTDVAEILGVHQDTVQRWADEGLLPHFRAPGGRSPRRFRRSDVDAFVLAHTTDGRTS